MKNSKLREDSFRMKNISTTIEEKHKFNVIDYMKALCMIIIVLEHSGTNLGPLVPLLIRLAVPILMVITGYNFCLSFNRRHMDIKTYYNPPNIIKKLSRIYSPWLLFFCVYRVFVHCKIVA